ncbi:hypothetical protein AAFF_G00084120 [Aldrovandia affinis]|uniref:Integrase catalytic domain-containing protein n=1 Tax=Aldrovandia affinis TaxID=143900 RepID=A0AAD7RZP0_9TELE|nr:hypothetical protein AAFF_G00084120 [Aldrovandia affinis]
MSGDTTRSSLKNTFAKWGCPNEVLTDNGPQFSGRDFQQFAMEYDFIHITTSPHNPQANSEAERAVQTAKKILKQSDHFLALINYRATPLQATGVSPAELMMDRQIRTNVPTVESNLKPQWPDLAMVREADEKAKRSYQLSFNRRHNARELSLIQPGSRCETG